MKFLLIEPNNDWPSAYNHLKMVKVGILLIAAEIRAAGHEVKVFSEALSGPIERHWELIEWADVIGLSIITAFAPDAYEIADLIRKKYPKKILIAGGVHPTFRADEALEHFDLVFRHRSSLTMRKFLEGGDMDYSINGISYRDGEKRIHNPDAELTEDLDSLLTPAYGAVIKPRKLPVGFAGSFETASSCPQRCDFCSVRPMMGDFVFSSPDTVVKQITAMQAAFGITRVLVAVDNFCADRERCLAVVDGINRAIQDGKITFFRGGFQCAVTMPLDKTFLRAIKPVWETIAVGLENIREDSYKKRGDLARVENFFRTIAEWGFHPHAMLIVDPDTTLEEMYRTVKKLREWKVQTAQFTVLTPLPGSLLYKRLVKQGDLDPEKQNWNIYNTFNTAPCYSPELGDLMNFGSVFFNSPRLGIEKILSYLKQGNRMDDSLHRFVYSIAIWEPAMRWALRNRGWKGLARALKWSAGFK